MILQNVIMGVHPSMAAASSYVLDRFWKKVIRNVVVYWICIPMYRKISSPLEPLMPS